MLHENSDKVNQFVLDNDVPTDCAALTSTSRANFRPANISTEITELPRWVNWGWQFVLGKCKKPPRDALDPHAGAINPLDPAHWRTFDQALATFQRYDFLAGVGFVLVADDDITALDIDDCLHGNELTTFAKSILRGVDSYADVSPSGHGIRILARANVLATVKRPEIEIYSHDRYVTLTGRHIAGTPRELTHRTEEIAGLVAEFGADSEPPKAERTTVGGFRRSDLAQLGTDNQVWARLMASKNGESIRKLLADDRANDRSNIDIRLINSLAFFSGGNRPQMRRILLSDRCENLRRAKWFEPRPAGDFLDAEIDSSIAFNIQRGWLK